MTSYEELVVDREVAAAWMTFRLRVADWLDSGDGFAVFTVEDDDRGRLLTVDRGGDQIFLTVDPADTAAVVAIDPAFRRARGGLRLCLDDHEVDRTAHVVATVLREVWGLVHPCLVSVDVTDGQELVLFPAPEPTAPRPVVVPELLRGADERQVREVVRAVLAEQMGSEPVPDADGDYLLRGTAGGHAWLVFQGRGRIEVSAVLASEVRFKAAHREADRLSRRFPYLRFHVRRDDLVVSTSLDSSVLVPSQVIELVRRTLGVSGRLGPDLDERLKRRRRPQPAVTPVDPALSLVAASATAMSHEHLVDALVEAAGDSYGRLESWLTVARRERVDALEAARDLHDGPLGLAARRNLREWRRTVAGLKSALERLGTRSVGHEAS